MSEIEPSFKNKRTMLDRFIERVRGSFQFFQGKPEKNIQLSGRILDLQRTAETVLDQLIKIKGELKDQVDAELFTFVEAVVDPMIRNVSRIQESVSHPNSSVAQQAQAFRKYSEWIDVSLD